MNHTKGDKDWILIDKNVITIQAKLRRESVDKENIKCQDLQVEYPALRLKLLRKDEEKYDLSIIICLLNEAKNGFKFKEIGKATKKKGTKITYTLISSEEDLKLYKKKLLDMLDKLNKKYNTNYCFK